MDGPFYVDSRGPHISATPAAITLTTTLQALVPVGAYPNLGANYFNWVGKALRMRAAGIATTGATPGNITLNLLWGNGTSNVGAGMCSTTFAGSAGLTNAVWQLEVLMRCRALGSSGQLFVSGFYMQQTTGFLMMPPTGAVVTTFDLTTNSVPSIQISRSGSTVETYQLLDLLLEAVN
jgi:hypothetical protein